MQDTTKSVTQTAQNTTTEATKTASDATKDVKNTTKSATQTVEDTAKSSTQAVQNTVSPVTHTTKLVSVAGSAVTFVSSTGATETHAVDQKTADALKRVTGTRVKVVTLADGTLQVTPLVQTTVARVSSIQGNILTVTSNDGKAAQLLMSPDAISQMQLRAGDAITTVSSDGGQSLLVVPAVASNPLSTVVVGTIVSVTDSTVTIVTGKIRRTLRINAALHRLLAVQLGKRIALQTLNGGIASALLSRAALKQLVAAAKQRTAADAAFIGSIASHSGSTLTLQSADGIAHDVACTGSCLNLLGTSLPTQAYYVVVTPDASVQQIVPLVDGTRMAAKFVAKTDDTLVALLPTGAVVTMACACDSLIPADAAPGDPLIVQVDHNGKVTSTQPYPASGVVVGKIVRVDDTRVAIQTADGRLVEYYCDCAGLRIGGVPVAPGQTIAAQLSPAGSVVAAAPLDASRRLTGRVALIRDRYLVIASGAGRLTVPLTMPSVSAPPVGTIAHVVLADDGTAKRVTYDSISGHLHCTLDTDAVPRACVKQREQTPVAVAVMPMDVLASADCDRNSGSVLTVAVTNRSTGL
ncbi:MAG: hypothetical protein JO165_02730, partial [Candidatus Eremiobacteraeota bacterium]|nr:hypothetical protein [Candidatus Eremiobacteraeota bacterium]